MNELPHDIAAIARRYDGVALVLQGGGALGAYQIGVYQALAEAGCEPNWISGVSIGAINSAIIAGNGPEKRLQNLEAFWSTVSGRKIWAYTRQKAIFFVHYVGHSVVGDAPDWPFEGVVTFGPCRARPLALILHDEQNQLRRLPLPS
jgi:predicted acylesterase/phospholipase RssA